MDDAIERFDAWIRAEFVELNTRLEDLYFAQGDRANTDGIGDREKNALVEAGEDHLAQIALGQLPVFSSDQFDLLGNIGLYFAALRRHELTNPEREKSSPFVQGSTLAQQLGAMIGVVPRFTAAHLHIRNRAVDGVFKRFTSLHDEYLFTDYNMLGVFAFQRAAMALTQIADIGISNPGTPVLLKAAHEALADVRGSYEKLFTELDPDRFFYCVRPYFKSYRVGRQTYRGANAGDFAGINEIDLLLGLCRADDPFYLELLSDKLLFLLPEHQAQIRNCMGRRPLMDRFLDAVRNYPDRAWLIAHGQAFIDVCEIYAQVSAIHHDKLVENFIVRMSGDLAEQHHAQLTASGPPLPALLASLEKLRDCRCARQRDDVQTAYDQMQDLKQAIGWSEAA